MSENSVNFSFNKGQKINLAKFDGVSKEELLNKQGITDGQKNLLQSIFSKYDNGDGVLSADEFKSLQADLIKLAGDNNLGKRELKKFNKNALGVDKKAYSMEDLQTVVGMMTDGSDSITNVAKDGEKVKITYKPQDGVGTKTSTFATGEKNNLTILEDDVVNNGVTTHIEYLNGDTTKRTIMTETKGNSKTTILYKDDGTSINIKTRVTGAVTEELDFENSDRVKTKTTDKGGGNVERTEYEYSDTGVVEKTYDTANGDKPVSIVTKDKDGNVTKTNAYTYVGDKTTVVETVGTGDDAVRTKTVKNGNKLESYVNVDANGNVLNNTHKVEAGDTWYGIVQAKYGVTDHKTTMEIVHKLKDEAGVAYSANKMPDEITLLAKITLKNGTEVGLKNKDALVNMKHGLNTAPRITPPANLTAGNIPTGIDPLPEEQKKIEIPTFEVKTDCANKTVKQDDGRYFQYNADGRVKRIYADEKAKDAKNIAVYIEYNDNGNVSEYQLNSFGDKGRWTGAIRYDGSGDFLERWVNDKFDDNGNPGRQTKYNADGSVNYVIDNCAYDGQGRDLSFDTFHPDGSWWVSRKLDYGNDGTCQTRYYEAKDKGRLTMIESFE